ncbi:MAG: hypothetical protein ABW168_06975 [Sedimenticola sp.]
MKRLLSALLLSLIVLLVGCAPTIGNRESVSSVTFEVGKTSKSTVAETLGLPADISRSEALAREYWAYQDETTLTGVIYALPTGGGTVTTYHASTGESGAYKFENAAVVYVFDKDGILIDVRKPEKKKL